MNSLVTIIIPTYNRVLLLCETLDSVLAQDYPTWECIVVDDGSDDETQQTVLGYAVKDNRFSYYRRPEHLVKGANACRNYGYAQSKGKFIKWLDSDDILLPDALRSQMFLFAKNTDAVVSKLAFTDFLTQKKIKENDIISDNLIEDYFTGKIAFYVSGPIWASKFLKQQSVLFDEKISNLDDWDFNLRMLYQHPLIIFNDDVIIKYRIHDNSLSAEISKLNIKEIKSEFYAREKHLRLIKQNKSASSRIITEYIKNRYKFFVRELLVSKQSMKYYFFYRLVGFQFRLFDYMGILKSVFGFTFYHTFGKGYKYLK
jgi:glycosyltransferase involved in cell wall biosynthesis